MTDRWIHRQTDGQTDRQTHEKREMRETDRETDEQAYTQNINYRRERQTDKKYEYFIYITHQAIFQDVDRQTDKQPGRCMDGQADK
jgi:hypothetical protein